MRVHPGVLCLARRAWAALLASAALRARRGHAVGKAARPDEECGVCVHAVFWAGSQALDLPLAHEGLPSLRLGEALQLADALHDLHQLWDGGHVGHEHAARNQDVAHLLEVLPWLEHIEDDAVNWAAQLVDGDIGQVTQARRPPLRLLTEVFLDVVHRVLEMIVANLVGEDVALWAHSTQQSHRKRARTRACLQDAGAHENVALNQDLSRVLGVNDGGAARHRQHVVHHEVAEEQEIAAQSRAHDRALVHSDDLVVADDALVRVEFPALFEHHGVVAALSIGQLDAIAIVKWSGVRHRGDSYAFCGEGLVNLPSMPQWPRPSILGRVRRPFRGPSASRAWALRRRQCRCRAALR